MCAVQMDFVDWWADNEFWWLCLICLTHHEFFLSFRFNESHYFRRGSDQILHSISTWQKSATSNSFACSKCFFCVLSSCIGDLVNFWFLWLLTHWRRMGSNLVDVFRCFLSRFSCSKIGCNFFVDYWNFPLFQ